jgi:hypothetical protein
MYTIADAHTTNVRRRVKLKRARGIEDNMAVLDARL